MGLLSSAWRAIDPFVPDEQIMGLLGRVQGGSPPSGPQVPWAGQPIMPSGPAGPQAQPVTRGQRFAAGLSDAGIALQGGQGQALAQLKAREQAAQRQAFLSQQIGGMFGGPGGQAGAGGSPPSVRDNATRLAILAANGYDVGDYINILDKSSPDIQVTNGVPYDKRDPSVLKRGRIGANLVNVNGNMIDTQDPANANRFVPQVGQGQEVLYDAQGRPSFVRNIDGSVQALAEQKGAEAEATEGARARLDLVTVPRSDGSSVQMPRSQAVAQLGGAPAGSPAGPPSGAPTVQGGPQLGVTQAPARAAYEGKRSEQSAARMDKVVTAGNSARSLKSSLGQVRGLLDGLTTGRMTPVQVAGSSVLSSLGVKVDPKMSNAEAAQAILSRMTLDMMGGSLSAGFSNADREFIVQQAPTLSMTPEGRAKLISYLERGAENNIKQAEFARQWERRYGSLDSPDPQGQFFDDYWGQWTNQNGVRR